MGPVYRMLADLGDPAHSRWQLTTGQSGQPARRHYDDMIEGWRTGKTNPVYHEEHEVRAAGGASACASTLTDGEQARPDQAHADEVPEFLAAERVMNVAPTARTGGRT